MPPRCRHPNLVALGPRQPVAYKLRLSRGRLEQKQRYEHRPDDEDQNPDCDKHGVDFAKALEHSRDSFLSGDPEPLGADSIAGFPSIGGHRAVDCFSA